MQTVNNYPFGIHDNGEVFIQTNPKQLEATGGKVYLTTRELQHLLGVIDTDSVERSDLCEQDKSAMAWLHCVLSDAQNAAAAVMNNESKSTTEQAVPAAFAAIRVLQDAIEKLVNKTVRDCREHCKPK